MNTSPRLKHKRHAMNAPERYDYQQLELERERIMKTFEALDRIAEAGFEEEAKFLAGECGVKWSQYGTETRAS